MRTRFRPSESATEPQIYAPAIIPEIVKIIDNILHYKQN
jgi:hypothetical protein